MPRVATRQPLRELPLCDYIPVVEDKLKSPLHAQKRAHSPAGQLLSPHKRRILTAEGLYSPTKKNDQFASPITKRLLGLSGPASPARKLDFGHPMTPTSPRKSTMHVSDNPFDVPFETQKTPTRCTSANLVPSPEILAISPSRLSLPLPSRRLDYDKPSTSHSRGYFATAEYRQSIHYPGFEIALDVEVTSYPTPTSNPSCSQDTEMSDSDNLKENVAPRRRMRTAVTLPIDKIQKTASPVRLSSSLPLSPHTSDKTSRTAEKLRGMVNDALLFTRPLAPKSRAPALGTHATLYSSPMDTERKRRRLELEREVDEEAAVDDLL